MDRTRQAMAEHAREAGFGRVVRVHRPLSSSWLYVVFVLAVVFGVPVAGVALLMIDPWLWRWPVLCLAVLVALMIAVRRWGPSGPREEQRWFVVAEHGLVVLTWDSVEVALPWDSVSVERDMGMRRIVWSDQEAPPSNHVVGRRDLLAAVERGGRLASWTPRRFARTATLGVAAALVAVFVVVPVALDVVLGPRPHELADLAEVCAGDGIGRAAAYEGEAPHPIAVFGDHPTPEYSAGAPADTVQLVGCQRSTSGSAPDATATCSYEGGHTLTIFQGTYEITVREARTARVVAVVGIDGERTTDCLEVLHVRTDDLSSDQELLTVPEYAAYERTLSDVTDGPARQIG
jgi:hypothetical protein